MAVFETYMVFLKYGKVENIMNITKNELVTKIESIKGATFVGLDYDAPVTMLKTGNPYASQTLTKVSSVSGQINGDYEIGVNTRRQNEGKATDFVVSERSWGEHVTPALIVNDKGLYSIQMRMLNHPSSVTYYLDGQPIDKKQIVAYLPKHKPSNSQGTDDPIIIRTYRIDRIKAIRIGGEMLNVV